MTAKMIISIKITLPEENPWAWLIIDDSIVLIVDRLIVVEKIVVIGMLIDVVSLITIT